MPENRNITVSAKTHQELKIVASHLDITMRNLMADIAKGMLPLVLQGINPLEQTEEIEQCD